MKKIITSLLICTSLIAANIPMVAQAATYQQFYVSPSGNDSNDGTQSKPFKTLQRAQEAVRAVNTDMTGDIYVNIAEGTYYLDKMLDFRTEDSGKNNNRVIWRGTGSNMPVISGGKVVSGFADSDDDGIYTADLSGMDINSVYQLSVNGKSRQVAKGATLVYGQEVNGSYYYDDPSIDPDGNDNDSTYTSTDGDYSYTAKYPDHDGLYVKKSDLGIYENIEDMYFLWNRGFFSTAVPVEKIEECSSDSSMLQVTMSYGWYDALTENYNVADIDSTLPYANMGFAVMNALELLDEPGEFYFDKSSKKLHYMPVKGENMQTATVVVPMLETLIYIDGNDITDKVTNLTFTNLEFTGTKWDIPYGFCNGQSNNFSGNGQSAIAPAAIFAERASGITINGCVISNTGAVGINYFNAVDSSTISGNAFYDIGASAILSGGANHNFSSSQLGTSGESATPTAAQKALPIDVVDHITTKTTVSSNYGVSNGPIAVLNSNKTESQHIWYYQQDSSALTYPGYEDPDDGAWVIPLSPHKINATWIDYNLSRTMSGNDYSGPRGVWFSDKTAEGTSSPSFVKYEFIRPYSISNIRVGIDTASAEATGNSSYLGAYEVLASNDENFETYVTFTEVADSDDSYTDWTTDSSEKFKYVMIRKLNNQYPLVLSRVWVASTDRTPYVKNQRCTNITVSNNLIDRVGVNTNHSSGIVFLHGSDHTITHNEIKHAGYSGMSIGYSWSADVQSCANMTVQYNRIYDVTRTSYDGGGIYTLGPQPGSIYSHNYIETVNQGINGFYTDNGSSEFEVSNNYIEDALFILAPYRAVSLSVSCTTSGASCSVYRDAAGNYYHYDGTSYYTASSISAKTHSDAYTGDTSALKRVGGAASIRNVTFESNFGTQTHSNDAAAEYNEWQEPNLEYIGLPSEAAYDTYTNAGLEEGYTYLYDLVPENNDNMYEDACYDDSTWNYQVVGQWNGSQVKTLPKATADELNYLLQNATFGEGLGMYPTSYAAKISNMLTFYKNAGYYFAADTDFSQRHSILKGLRLDLKNAVRRYSLSQTLAMCDELISTAKANVVTEPESGKYPESAVSAATTSLANVKAMSQSTSAEEYNKLIAAENVYNTLLAGRYGGTIVDVVCDSVVDVDIDNIEDVVTIYLPAGADTTAVANVNIITDMSSILAKAINGSADLSTGIKVPVTCKNSGKTRMWTIKAKTAASTSKMTMNDWTAIADGNEFIRYGANFASLAGSPYAYVTTKSAGNNTAAFSFKPYAPNDTKEMSLLFGIDTCENFYYSDTNNSSDYFELVLSGSTATLYSVVDGVKTQITSGTSGINWNGDNTVSYTVSAAGALTVNLNSKTFTGTNAGITGGYAGIYSPTVNVAVK